MGLPAGAFGVASALLTLATRLFLLNGTYQWNILTVHGEDLVHKEECTSSETVSSMHANVSYLTTLERQQAASKQ
eukprot:1160380-Pelagomonas_calceolata.AAC.4